uniref:Uncharacterized protein n=1 Tax=Meloidogyne enterolobii TaxID=390850 RepID=A0A6V7UPK6_MELEN|nr:unnamed protein product [Meloidogyne enterolobii]
MKNNYIKAKYELILKALSKCCESFHYTMRPTNGQRRQKCYNLF